MLLPLSDCSGVIQRHVAFPSNFVPARNVDIWLPEGYTPGSSKRYPVLYMHDGQNLFDPSYAFGGVDWGIDEALSALSAEGLVPETIVVGIWNNENRWCEYMPQIPWQAEGGGRMRQFLKDRCSSMPCISDNYLQFLVSELKPFIDRAYPTLPERDRTFIMGSSMGGLISLYALCSYPQVFGGAGCLSAHWPAGEEYLVDYFSSVLPAPGHHKLYFDFGDQGMDALYEPYQNRMDGWLKKAGYSQGKDCLTRKFPGADHSETYWRARLDVPLKFLLRSA